MKLKGFYSSLVAIAIPVSLQNLLANFVNMLDTVMIGRLGGTEIAAVGLGNQIFFILNMVLFGIASGGGVFISQFWGKNDLKGIRRSLGIILCLSVVVSSIFTLLFCSSTGGSRVSQRGPEGRLSLPIVYPFRLAILVNISSIIRVLELFPQVEFIQPLPVISG